MAVLDIIAQQIIRLVSGGDQSKDSKLDRREVIKYLLQTLNAQLKVDYINNIKIENDHSVSDQYIFTATATIQFDTIRGEAYIILPTPYSALPHEKGLHEITPTNGKCETFIPIRNGSISLFRGLPAGNLEGKIGFYPERNKVYFAKNPKSKGVDKVMIKLIVAFGDDLVVDPSTEELLLAKGIEFFGVKVNQDPINNNVDE